MSKNNNSDNDKKIIDTEYGVYLIENIPIQQPNPFINITCGRINIIMTKRKENDNEIQTKLNTLEIQLTRKQRSDIHQRNTLLYLYFLLLAIDPTAQIILNQNARDPEDKQIRFKTFTCHSIISRGQCIFQKGIKYKIVFNEEKQFHTVELDEATDSPVIDESSDKIYNRETKNRIEQHILIQVINKRLKEMNKELKYYIRNSTNTKLIASIQFDEFIDINDEYLLEEKSRLKENKTRDGDYNKFQQLCNTIFDILVYLIDRTNGFSKQLVIGDIALPTSCFYIHKECTWIGRWKLFQVIQEVRNKQRTIEELFSPEQFIQFQMNLEVNEMKQEQESDSDKMQEEGDDDDESDDYSNGFLQSDL